MYSEARVPQRHAIFLALCVPTATVVTHTHTHTHTHTLFQALFDTSDEGAVLSKIAEQVGGDHHGSV